ncbi:protein-tyrosine phosphatase family protein [Agrococcus sp. SGAir0287]|uniref:protein-tyrosine phosphatase family protein n=1 Tax=Agrococcus sp. SGAir0287 TaxID=2070347 RepID=UPI0010CCDC14|nr:protein-tyrosine phosphatase family protein [Agrococcus sp. SGAir0287]QCR20363.1 protein phosphatase [Agrococcus sp. SGAir0287]
MSSDAAEDAAARPARRTWDADAPGVVTLPDGRMVRGRGLRRGAVPAGGEPDLGAYLLARAPDVAWPSIWISWRDFGMPRDSTAAIAALRRIHAAAAEARVEVACAGGIGRTGTALAILARMSGVPADVAVAWVRERYDPRAVETPGQRRLVATMALD